MISGEPAKAFADRVVLQVANTVDELRQRLGVQRQRHVFDRPDRRGSNGQNAETATDKRHGLQGFRRHFPTKTKRDARLVAASGNVSQEVQDQWRQ